MSAKPTAGHTQGPWFVGGDGGTGDPRMVFCDDALGSSVADCRKHGAGVTSDQALANAHLIAAAPDLLEALEQAYDAMREPTGEWHDVRCNKAMVAARAAIAKAGGR